MRKISLFFGIKAKLKIRLLENSIRDFDVNRTSATFIFLSRTSRAFKRMNIQGPDRRQVANLLSNFSMTLQKTEFFYFVAAKVKLRFVCLYQSFFGAKKKKMVSYEKNPYWFSRYMFSKFKPNYEIIR